LYVSSILRVFFHEANPLQNMTGHLITFWLLSLPMIHRAQLSPDVRYRYESIVQEISVTSFHHYLWKKKAVNKKATYISCSFACSPRFRLRFTFFRGNLRADQIYRRILQPGCYEENIKSTSCFMIFSDKSPFYLLCLIYIYIYNYFVSARARVCVK